MCLSSEGDVLHKLVLVLCVCAGTLYKRHRKCPRLTEQVLITARGPGQSWKKMTHGHFKRSKISGWVFDGTEGRNQGKERIREGRKKEEKEDKRQERKEERMSLHQCSKSPR